MILVPVKDLQNAKQRLSPCLAPEQRTSLARSMVEDVFDALAPFAADPGVAVVSGDPWASQQAKARKFTIIIDDLQAGETEAIAMATSFCLNMGSDFTLVFPADIPLITSDEVSNLLTLKPMRGCVIAPAHDQRGTNGILRRPADLIPLKFGNDSFLPHLAAARATGHEVIVRDFPGIGLDIDRPEDVSLLMTKPVRSRAQRLLLEWNVKGEAYA
ncbi:MAG TPA: 2-phospho-L-lactate guanylyltransferase [Terriglobales bacterium]|nr:2-phospho-L-lactate guanylyltransferase [Terriglobales bacterium]